MHAAPPVRIILAADKTWRRVGAGCAVVAAANTAAWLAQHAGQPAAITAAAALVAAVAAVVWLLAWARDRDMAAGVLTWDGAQWQWTKDGGDAAAGAVRVMLDLGLWLLLRFQPTSTGHARWLAATRAMAGPLWPAWRAALYARAPRRPVAGDMR